MTDDDLPEAWRTADASSLAGQRTALATARARLGGSLLAAFGGAITWTAGRLDLAAWLITIGFTVALVGEIRSWATRPEQTWYAGRATAESVKSLAWRYSVAADPFPRDLGSNEARTRFRDRLREVAEKVPARGLPGSGELITPGMARLRAASFTERRTAYIAGRTETQQRWYAAKAAASARAADQWRTFLLTAEVTAVVLAALRLTGGWSVDFAGIFGALVAAGAAWLALKQHAPLAAAYSTAAMELGLQADLLRHTTQTEWAAVAADAEEAISREHTLWLASRNQPA